MQYVTIQFNPNQFSKGLRYARQARGRYNPVSRTWSIPAACNMLNLPSAYGWIIVDDQRTRAEQIADHMAETGTLPEDC